jgi:hypothetical protein
VGSLILVTILSSALLPLPICLSSIVTSVDDEVLGPVIELAAQVAGQDGLGALSITLLRIERGTRHMGDHGVAATEGVLGVAEGMVLGSGLGEPNVTAIASKVARLEGLGNVLLYDDGATGGVDEVGAWGGVSMATRCPSQMQSVLPFFILLMSSLLKRPLVFS